MILFKPQKYRRPLVERDLVRFTVSVRQKPLRKASAHRKSVNRQLCVLLRHGKRDATVVASGVRSERADKRQSAAFDFPPRRFWFAVREQYILDISKTKIPVSPK